ncbi:MAG: MBL fold metallo-hydrolase [Candidatus Thorarchaeota archaeon]|jgi:glyoxylase-like metal-dependent hydrolase (beta-lactamase superfamily II)
MKVEKISSRGLLFSFKDPFLTNVYVILGAERVFVLDTFLGSKSMEIVKQTIEDEGFGDRPLIVFNSHGDYDHYWGNAAFDNALIIGHEECRERIMAESETALIENQEQKKGEVIIKAPTEVFLDRLSFPDDGVTFFHTPGHTIDSASCFDEVDKVLFIGDNVETPLPYVYSTDIAQFYNTLKSYLEIEWDVMIASHAPPLYDKSLLERNIEYLTNLQNWRIDTSKLSEDELHLHAHNCSYLEENFEKSELTPDMVRHFEEVRKVKHQ